MQQRWDWAAKLLPRTVIFPILLLLLVPLAAAADVRITSLNDIPLSWSGESGISGDDDVCVYNSANDKYRVTVTGNGPGFQVNDGGNSISYTAFWNDQSGTSGNQEVTSGVQTGEQSGANTSSQTCSGGVNANIEVVFSSSDLYAAEPGTYTGNLTISIAPSP